MPRVIHFEVSVDKPERAIKLYENVFGWKILKWEGPARAGRVRPQIHVNAQIHKRRR